MSVRTEPNDKSDKEVEQFPAKRARTSSNSNSNSNNNSNTNNNSNNNNNNNSNSVKETADQVVSNL